MANDDKKSEGSFLGGAGLKFNTAGNNAPLPGEKVSETPPPPPFGGPKVWAGIFVIIVAAIALFFVVYQQQNLESHGSHRPGATTDSPNLNPDTK